jgi:P27 family predicted phage terminase small subunit
MSYPRKPIAEHKLEGTYRATRHRNRNEPDGGPPLATRPPAWLSAEARKVWREVLRLAPINLLRRADTELVGIYAEVTVRYRQMLSVQRNLDAGSLHPFLLVDEYGRPRRISPVVRELRQLEQHLLLLGNQLGLSPRGRTYILLSPAAPGPGVDDEFKREFGELVVLRGGRR